VLNKRHAEKARLGYAATVGLETSMELSGSSCYMQHGVGQEPKLQQNGKRTAGLLVVGYGRQLAVLGSS